MVPFALPRVPFALPVTSTLSPSGDTANALLNAPARQEGDGGHARTVHIPERPALATNCVVVARYPTATLPFAEVPRATTKFVVSAVGHPGAPAAGHTFGMTTLVAARRVDSNRVVVVNGAGWTVGRIRYRRERSVVGNGERASHVRETGRESWRGSGSRMWTEEVSGRRERPRLHSLVARPGDFAPGSRYRRRQA